MTNHRYLKGDPFVNRVRITGKLTTCSPLHIGTGTLEDYEVETKEGKKETRKKATIVTDHLGKPLIPGSSLRGVMRHWLLQVLRPVNAQWASFPDRDNLLEENQQTQIEKARSEFSWLELLFGTAFNAGKIEVWDAACQTGNLQAPDGLLHWNPTRLTYIATSVVIDPETGTAKEKLLYNFELVPPGVEFQVNITGQNLSPIELGLLLLALKGFNSQIYPIRLGARGGRGFGHMQWAMGEVYYLGRDKVSNWIEGLIQRLDDSTAAEDAGFFALPKLDAAAQDKLVKDAKAALLQAMQEAGHV
ncbi:hypothetical protein D6833_04205 [Candidatus Parcubacteria bacterium]|nr:MAG: hypothetical protein D6833_04205 [Candidatus Parcubacteria bacterium]